MTDQKDPRDERAGLPTAPHPVFRPALAENRAPETPRQSLKIRSAAHVCARAAARALGIAAPALAREVCAQMANHLQALLGTIESTTETLDGFRQDGAIDPVVAATIRADLEATVDAGRAILELVAAMRPV